MSGRPDILDRVRAVRPADPDPAETPGLAVRTLARFAILEAGRAAARPARRSRLLRVAAVLAVAVLPLATLGSSREAEAPAPTAAGPQTWQARVERALAGDVLARARLTRAGLPARKALLTAAERGGTTANAALGLLRAAGPLRSADEARRIARLARDAELRVEACRLLARDLGTNGPRHLGALLAASGEGAEDVVAALEDVAARGRRDAALRGLLAGVQQGRVQAVAAAVRVAGSAHLPRVLAALPQGDDASEAVAAAALRAGSATVRARLVRMAERGDGRALRLAAKARVAGIVRVLARETTRKEPRRAKAAVDLLARYGGPRAWVALARAVDGPASERATGHLRAGPRAVDAALAQTARGTLRDAPAAVHALAVRGSTQELFDLARESRLAPEAIAGLARTDGARAAALLAQLAQRPAWSARALDALAARLRDGRADAGPVLLALARGGQERAVLRLLARSGEAGAALLRTAASDPALGARARQTLDRIPAARAAPRWARTARRASPARSI